MIDILLSTYNGEKYIKELLDSLLNQTYPEIKIMIRDDGSSDNTVNIIKDYENRYSNIVSVNDELGNLGSTKSFLELMRHSISEYIAFCDQDDVWADDKLKLCCDELSRHNEPTLVFSDMELIDSNNNSLYDSYYAFMNRDPRKCDLQTILNYRGLIPGCSMVFNRQLKDLLIYKDINNIDFHDLYLSYIAAAFGNIVYIDKCLVKYRQTGENQVGANNDGFYTVLLKNIKSYKYAKKFIKTQGKSYLSLCEFKKNYFNLLDEEKKELLLYEINNDNIRKWMAFIIAPMNR